MVDPNDAVVTFDGKSDVFFLKNILVVVVAIVVLVLPNWETLEASSNTCDEVEGTVLVV